MKHFYPRTLFQGLSATFTREVPGFSIYFSTYNYLKSSHLIRTGDLEIPIYMAFMYGGMSGAMSWFGIYPQDLIKTRMQSQVVSSKHPRPSFFNTAKQIYMADGLKGFFKGFHLALMRAVPLHAGTFCMMEIMKKYGC